MAGLSLERSGEIEPAQRLFSVGLTGGIGSGKTAVATLFAEQNVPVIDTDVIAHALTSAGGAAMPAIETTFGKSFIATDGALERNRMRAIVFSDAAARKQLEAILHPLITHEAERTALAVARSGGHAGQRYILFVVPLLVESHYWRERVDRILVVDCDEKTQLERVMRRNGMTATQAGAIMAAQASRMERLTIADDVINNNDDIICLPPQVTHFHAHYQAQCSAWISRPSHPKA